MKAILFDLDGVVYNGETLIEGAPEALAWVRREQIPHLFVTNTTSRGRRVLAEKLRGFGIPARDEDILTPCIAAIEHIRIVDNGTGNLALFVPDKTKSEFAGMPCVPNDAESGARWILVGDLGTGWDFTTLNRAFRLLQASPDATLIALGMTRFWQAEDGLRLDAAPYVAALECATGKEAVVLGKPAPAFFQAAARKIGYAPSELVMIGDDIRTDVGGAQESGLKGVLVRTGKFRPENLTGTVSPDAVLESIAKLPEWWQA